MVPSNTFEARLAVRTTYFFSLSESARTTRQLPIGYPLAVSYSKSCCWHMLAFSTDSTQPQKSSTQGSRNL